MTMQPSTLNSSNYSTLTCSNSSSSTPYCTSSLCSSKDRVSNSRCSISSFSTSR